MSSAQATRADEVMMRLMRCADEAVSSAQATRADEVRNNERQREATDKAKAHMEEFINKFRANAKRAAMVQSRVKVSAHRPRRARAGGPSRCTLEAGGGPLHRTLHSPLAIAPPRAGAVQDGERYMTVVT